MNVTSALLFFRSVLLIVKKLKLTFSRGSLSKMGDQGEGQITRDRRFGLNVRKTRAPLSENGRNVINKFQPHITPSITLLSLYTYTHTHTHTTLWKTRRDQKIWHSSRHKNKNKTRFLSVQRESTR